MSFFDKLSIKPLVTLHSDGAFYNKKPIDVLLAALPETGQGWVKSDADFLATKCFAYDDGENVYLVGQRHPLGELVMIISHLVQGEKTNRERCGQMFTVAKICKGSDDSFVQQKVGWSHSDHAIKVIPSLSFDGEFMTRPCIIDFANEKLYHHALAVIDELYRQYTIPYLENDRHGPHFVWHVLNLDLEKNDDGSILATLPFHASERDAIHLMDDKLDCRATPAKIYRVVESERASWPGHQRVKLVKDQVAE